MGSERTTTAAVARVSIFPHQEAQGKVRAVQLTSSLLGILMLEMGVQSRAGEVVISSDIVQKVLEHDRAHPPVIRLRSEQAGGE